MQPEPQLKWQQLNYKKTSELSLLSFSFAEHIFFFNVGGERVWWVTWPLALQVKWDVQFKAMFMQYDISCVMRKMGMYWNKI